MFVLEEALSFFDSKLIFRTYFTCAVSYFTLKLLSEGHYLSTSDLQFSTAALAVSRCLHACMTGAFCVSLLSYGLPRTRLAPFLNIYFLVNPLIKV